MKTPPSQTGLFQAPVPPARRGHTQKPEPPPLKSTLGPLNGLLRPGTMPRFAALAMAGACASVLPACQTRMVSDPAGRIEREEAALVAGLLALWGVATKSTENTKKEGGAR